MELTKRQSVIYLKGDTVHEMSSLLCTLLLVKSDDLIIRERWLTVRNGSITHTKSYGGTIMNDKLGRDSTHEAKSGRVVIRHVMQNGGPVVLSLTSDQDCRLNYNFRSSPVIDEAKQRCAFEMDSIAKLRKEMAQAHEEAMASIRKRQRFIQRWYDSAVAESKRTKARRATLSKVKVTFTIPRETCRTVGCYNLVYRKGLCESCLTDNGMNDENHLDRLVRG